MVAKAKPIIFLAVLILLQCWCFDYFKYVKMEPRSIHSWRQSDCLSFSECFYNGTSSIMETRVHNLGATGTGKVASDFPIIQWVVAKIWKVTGVNPTVFRLINLAFLLFGLLYIYKLFKLNSSNNQWLSIILTGLFFTSPILSYYGPTFLSDIHAFSLSIIGFYYFQRWLNEGKTKHRIIFLCVFAMAGLLKMSSAFIYLVALAFYLIHFISAKKSLKTFITDSLFFAAPLVPWALWYIHANAYNIANPNGFFLIGVLPIWEIPAERIKEIASSLFNYILPQMINPVVWWLIAGTLIAFLSQWKRREIWTGGIRLLVVFGVLICFILLFYQVFDVHDYYMLNMFNLLVIGASVIIKFIDELGSRGKQMLFSSLCFVTVVFTYSTAIKTRGRIDYKDGWGIKEPVLTSAERQNLDYNTWYDRTRYAVLEDRSIDWEKVGIGKNDIVFCLGDFTINRSLYLINRYGYTNFNAGLIGIGKYIEERKEKNDLKYLILIEPDWKQNEELAKYFVNLPVFQRENVSVYKL